MTYRTALAKIVLEPKHSIKQKYKWSEITLNGYTVFPSIKLSALSCESLQSYIKRYQPCFSLFYIFFCYFGMFLLLNCNCNLITYAPNYWYYIYIVILFHSMVTDLFLYHYVPKLEQIYSCYWKSRQGMRKAVLDQPFSLTIETVLLEEPQNIEASI